MEFDQTIAPVLGAGATHYTADRLAEPGNTVHTLCGKDFVARVVYGPHVHTQIVQHAAARIAAGNEPFVCKACLTLTVARVEQINASAAGVAA